MLAINADFEVQVRPCRETRASHAANHLACFHRRAIGDAYGAEMSVERAYPVAVVNNDSLPISAAQARICSS